MYITKFRIPTIYSNTSRYYGRIKFSTAALFLLLENLFLLVGKLVAVLPVPWYSCTSVITTCSVPTSKNNTAVRVVPVLESA